MFSLSFFQVRGASRANDAREGWGPVEAGVGRLKRVLIFTPFASPQFSNRNEIDRGVTRAVDARLIEASLLSGGKC